MKSVAQLLGAAAAYGMVANRFKQPANQVLLDWEVPGTDIRAALLFFVDASGPGLPVPMVMYPTGDPDGVWESSTANAETPPESLGQLLVRLRHLILDRAGPDYRAADIARWENDTLHLFNGLWQAAGSFSLPQDEIRAAVQPVSRGKAADCVVVDETDLAHLRADLDELFDSASEEGCEEPHFVGNIEHLNRLRDRLKGLRSRPVMESIRLVDAEDEEHGPLMVILPVHMTTTEAVAVFEGAIRDSNAETAARKAPNVDYHDTLVDKLQSSGLQVEFGIEQLGSMHWDAATMDGEPPAGDADWVEVTFTHGPESTEEWNQVEVGTLTSGEQVRYSRGGDIGAFATELLLRHPRGDKYGVPLNGGAEAQARQFVLKALDIACARDFTVTLVDTGDDSMESWSIRARVHNDFLEPVEQPRQVARPS